MFTDDQYGRVVMVRRSHLQSIVTVQEAQALDAGGLSEEGMQDRPWH